VILTSSASAGVFLERHVANLRLGMTLELFTAVGAVVGGLAAFVLPEAALDLLFAGLLIYTSVTMARRGRVVVPPEGGLEAAASSGDGSFLATLSTPEYHVRNIVPGAVGSFGAGIVSALLGIGGGLIKVPVMHVVMGVPLRVATATSNLMMGITASAGAIIYLVRGSIDPYVASPVAIGVFLGASIGSRIVHRIELRVIRGLFVAVLLYTAWQMLQRAVS
jgi:uncharacterized membrane protein YfcA